MSKIWKFEAIYKEDRNDDIDIYFRTNDEGTRETVIKYILDNRNKYGDSIIEPVYQNLMFLKNDENVEVDLVTFNEVLNDQTDPIYKIQLYEIYLNLIDITIDDRINVYDYGTDIEVETIDGIQLRISAGQEVGIKSNDSVLMIEAGGLEIGDNLYLGHFTNKFTFIGEIKSLKVNEA